MRRCSLACRTRSPGPGAPRGAARRPQRRVHGSTGFWGGGACFAAPSLHRQRPARSLPPLPDGRRRRSGAAARIGGHQLGCKPCQALAQSRLAPDMGFSCKVWQSSAVWSAHSARMAPRALLHKEHGIQRRLWACVPCECPTSSLACTAEAQPARAAGRASARARPGAPGPLPVRPSRRHAGQAGHAPAGRGQETLPGARAAPCLRTHSRAGAEPRGCLCFCWRTAPHGLARPVVMSPSSPRRGGGCRSCAGQGAHRLRTQPPAPSAAPGPR